MQDSFISRRELLRWGAGALAAGTGLTLLPREVLALTARQGNAIVNVAWTMIGTPYRLPPSPNYQAPPYPRPRNTDCSPVGCSASTIRTARGERLARTPRSLPRSGDQTSLPVGSSLCGWGLACWEYFFRSRKTPAVRPPAR